MCLDALEELLEHAALAGVRRHEIEDQAVLFLAVTVDAAHALLQPHRVPRDVVVDHQPAELQVDAFARGFGGDEDLAGLAELALGVDAGAGRVAVADLHAAVNLRHGQAPFAQLCRAGRPSLPSAQRKSSVSLCSVKMSSFMFGSAKMPCSVRSYFSRLSFDSTSRFSSVCAS